MKLVNSLVAFTTTWVSLEGLSLAAKSGIDVQRAVEVLRTDGAANFYLDRMVEGIDDRDRPTQFALELAAKDAGLIVDRGRALGVPTPAGAAVLQVLVGRDRRRPRRPRLERPRRRRRAPGRRRAPLVHRHLTVLGVTGVATPRCPATPNGGESSVRDAEDVGGGAQRGHAGGDAGVDADLHEHLDQLVAATGRR